MSKMGSMIHFDLKNMYFYINYSDSLKVAALDMFQNNNIVRHSL